MKTFRYISTLFLAATFSSMLDAQPTAEQWIYYTQGIGDSLTLPVEILHFTANAESGVILLSWSTASETNNDFYTLQRSADGDNYLTIAVVPGAGNSSEQQNYTFSDDASTGTYYYRLMQTDYDGSARYIGYTWCKTNIIDYAKPVITYSTLENTIQLSVYSEKSQPVNVVLYDETGKELLASFMEASKGINQFSINTNSVNKGIYICRVAISNEWFSEKIYVN